MATAQQNTFDGRKLADLIGLIDSPVEAEAAGAVHRIRVLKKKHGDVPFYALVETEEYKAAAWEKFGGCASPCDAGGKCHHGPEGLRAWFEAKHGGGNSGELTEARTLLEKLRQDNAQLEKDGAALAHAVKRQEQIIGEVQWSDGQRARIRVLDAAELTYVPAGNVRKYTELIIVHELVHVSLASLSGENVETPASDSVVEDIAEALFLGRVPACATPRDFMEAEIVSLPWRPVDARIREQVIRKLTAAFLDGRPNWMARHTSACATTIKTFFARSGWR